MHVAVYFVELFMVGFNTKVWFGQSINLLSLTVTRSMCYTISSLCLSGLWWYYHNPDKHKDGIFTEKYRDVQVHFGKVRSFAVVHHMNNVSRYNKDM